jgi:hypothetical protein
MSTETPAETIMRAAVLLRQRAEVAPRGPWWTGEGAGGTGYPKLLLGEDGPIAAVEWTMAKSWPAAGDYIASMHPLVGAALAELLDKIAWMVGADPDLMGRVGCEEVLKIARAYLGGVPR